MAISFKRMYTYCHWLIERMFSGHCDTECNIIINILFPPLDVFFYRMVCQISIFFVQPLEVKYNVFHRMVCENRVLSNF